jgi:hypothetical protein
MRRSTVLSLVELTFTIKSVWSQLIHQQFFIYFKPMAIIKFYHLYATTIAFSNVGLKRRRLRETLLTSIALVGSLPGVRSVVSVETGRFIETLFANLAEVSFLEDKGKFCLTDI